MKKLLLLILCLAPLTAGAWEQQGLTANGDYPTNGVICDSKKYSVAWLGTIGSATLTLKYKAPDDTLQPVPSVDAWTTATDTGTNITWAFPLYWTISSASGTTVDLMINCIP